VSAGATIPVFKDALGAAANTLALAYAAAGTAAGFLLMAEPRPLVAGAGVVLTAHAMFIAAYLVHEACHDAIFEKHAHNRVAGELMSFVAGSCYASY
jgi:acyl-lipid omega-6 desaturase (Delta-12 desaturase)